MNDGETLRTMIKQKGLKFTELANILGIHRANISRDLNMTKISNKRLEFYLNGLNVSFEEFERLRNTKYEISTNKKNVEVNIRSFEKVIEAQSQLINVLREELAEYREEKKLIKRRERSQSGSQ